MADRIAAGVSAIVPASAVMAVISGTEGKKIKVETGDHNCGIDARIAEIKREGGLG